MPYRRTRRGHRDLKANKPPRRPTALQCIVLGVTIVVGLADVHVIQAQTLARRWRAKNVTARVNIAESRTRTFGSSFVDSDRDGDSDLFLNRHWNPAHFYISRASRFGVHQRTSLACPVTEAQLPDKWTDIIASGGRPTGMGVPICTAP